MRKDIVRQWVNVLALVVTFVINSLAAALPLGGLTTGEISDLFPVYFTPANYVFRIWFLIYAALFGFIVYQALPSQRENPRLRRVGYLFVLSALANTVWLLLWHFWRFPLSLVAMIVLLLTLIVIYLRLGIGRTRVSTAETWLVRVPFSIYLGWITVATIANATTVLQYFNWSGWGLSPQVWTVIMLAAATVIGALVSLRRGDAAYMLVLVWAFAGIAVKHAATPVVAIAAWVAAALAAVMLVVGVLLKRARGGGREARSEA
ncbi:MAG: tryptophan-rich sensory protein [Anaerolineae bacterium]|nr:tryptophan-rich sensory protein [Anaerolineae bacterium]